MLLLVGCLGALFGVVAVGCGLDDSGVNVLGEDAIGNKDASLVDTGITPTGDSGPTNDGGPPACVPAQTCANHPGSCDPNLKDECGNVLNCKCDTGYDCVVDGGPGPDAAAYVCNEPPKCSGTPGASGSNCGRITYPNGLFTDCVACANTTTDVCYASTCCTKKTCAANFAGTCGNSNNDGCGSTVDCTNACAGGTACAPDKVCDTPPTCTNKGMPGGSCGMLTSTHGIAVDCMGCSNGYACSAAHVCACPAGQVTCNSNSLCCGAGQVCNANACCTPDSNTTTCDGKCGTVTNNCGQLIACGDCDGGDVCYGTAKCNCGHTQCDPGKTCHTFGSDRCD